MREGIDFYYDGVRSVDMGLYNVKLDGGMFSETFVATRKINEISVRGNDKPYFQGVEREPLEFSLTFAFADTYDSAKIREVARWLDQDYYKPFYTTDNPERIYYCILESSSELVHNGLKQGYITLKMRCDSPFSYSPEYVSDIYDFNNSPILVKEDTQENFQTGEIRNLVATSTGELQLDSVMQKWSDFSATDKWENL